MQWILSLWSQYRTVLLAAGVVLLGTATYWAARQYLAGREWQVEQSVKGRYREVPVTVARRELVRGTVLEASMLAARAMPERFLAADAVSAERAGTAIGRKLARDLRAGEALSESLLESTERPALAALVEPGQRALTIVVDEVSSSAGLLVPGDRIDLLYLPQIGAADDDQPSIRPLLQSVSVVATGQRFLRRRTAAADGSVEEREQEFGTITLHVSALDAARIALAQRTGEVTAVLRSPHDPQQAVLPALSLRELLGVQVARPSAARIARAPVFEIISGGGAALANVAAQPVSAAGSAP